MPGITITNLTSQMRYASLTRSVGTTSDNDTSSSSISSHNTNGMGSMNGWGSISSRKSYACLSSLGSEGGNTDMSVCDESRGQLQYPGRTRTRTAGAMQTESWGYFVDLSDGGMQI
uniref:Uncharacterized protein n=1 Tax=Ditylum brightwellii TaxID=49249 RepID=A0A6S8R9Q0_9STRA|mmetsp:Transcript_14493/g.21395  ORF Transcript_14493/g.21395 Transcript_14493/m.21395 type:complete len:116 (-) Transcript_14493:235-582(-)